MEDAQDDIETLKKDLEAQSSQALLIPILLFVVLLIIILALFAGLNKKLGALGKPASEPVSEPVAEKKEEEPAMKKAEVKPEEKEPETPEDQAGTAGKPDYTTSQLQKMKKSELVQITESLELSEKGTKEDIIKRILAHED